jgi:hypothetical protein
MTIREKKKLMLYFIPIFLMALTSPSVFCQKTHTLPDFVKKEIANRFPSSRIAKQSDFISPLLSLKEIDKKKYLRSVIAADLNGDSQEDYTVLLISEDKKRFYFVSFLSEGKTFKTYLLSSSQWPSHHDKKIWEVMWLKPKGEYGLGSEKYFNAPNKTYPFLKEHTQQDIKEYRIATERYKGMVVIEKTTLKYGSFDPDDLFYCKTSFYYSNSRMKSVSKCD